MKRYVVFFCMTLASVLVAIAQTDPQLGQYMFMQTAYNPAAAGDGDLMRVAGLHRMQFTGIKNAPMTTYFSFSSPFMIGKTKHAAGVRFLNDRYGLFSNQTFYVQYAYKHKIGKGYLSAGIDLGFVNMAFAVDSVNLNELSGLIEDGNFFQESDNAIPRTAGSEGGASGMGFDLGVGVYYSSPFWWAGVSYSHVTRPTLDWSDLSAITMVGTFYVSGGYHYRFKGTDWAVKPSVMMMTDFRNWDVNLTMMAEVKDKYRFALGYRILGSVNVLLGMDIVNGLQIGYSYEMPTNRLLLESYGSHEIFLAYGFNILRPKRTNKYKSVRYL